jgi:hypothetical protein
MFEDGLGAADIKPASVLDRQVFHHAILSDEREALTANAKATGREVKL